MCAPFYIKVKARLISMDVWPHFWICEWMYRERAGSLGSRNKTIQDITLWFSFYCWGCTLLLKMSHDSIWLPCFAVNLSEGVFNPHMAQLTGCWSPMALPDGEGLTQTLPLNSGIIWFTWTWQSRMLLKIFLNKKTKDILALNVLWLYVYLVAIWDQRTEKILVNGSALIFMLFNLQIIQVSLSRERSYRSVVYVVGRRRRGLKPFKGELWSQEISSIVMYT